MKQTIKTLTDLRNEKGLTLQQLVETIKTKTGKVMSLTMLYYLETSQRRMSLENASVFAEVYGVKLDDILRLTRKAN